MYQCPHCGAKYDHGKSYEHWLSCPKRGGIDHGRSDGRGKERERGQLVG